MGIRGRLPVLAVGIAVPLGLVGVADIRGGWESSRAQLGGSISVESPPAGESRGTVFTVRLPRRVSVITYAR
ncbi:MAG TPA: hypothetical protein VN228_07375 [Pyrinomonadaceae bacterium]|nr:hypothetical protein [Pyrinomonadaceae bacterium]